MKLNGAESKGLHIPEQRWDSKGKHTVPEPLIYISKFLNIISVARTFEAVASDTALARIFVGKISDG